MNPSDLLTTNMHKRLVELKLQGSTPSKQEVARGIRRYKAAAERDGMSENYMLQQLDDLYRQVEHVFGETTKRLMILHVEEDLSLSGVAYGEMMHAIVQTLDDIDRMEEGFEDTGEEETVSWEVLQRIRTRLRGVIEHE